MLVSIIIAIVVGAIIGWIASKLMNTDAEQGAIGNIVVGIVGAFLGNLLIAPLIGQGANITGGNNTLGEFLVSLLVGVAGACILLAIVNLFRTGGRRVR